MLKRRNGESVRSTLFASRSASDLRNIGEFNARVGRPVVVDAAVEQGPVLIGVELPGDLEHAAARTRFSADIAAPLTCACRRQSRVAAAAH